MPRKKVTPAMLSAATPPAPIITNLRAPDAPPAPLPPSHAVIALQEQVVALVSQRTTAREALSERHAVYLAAQAQFQAAEAALKDVEADIQYRIGLIAQLENRAPAIPPVSAPTGAVIQMPNFQNISSVPTQPSAQNYAMGDATALRRELRGMI